MTSTITDTHRSIKATEVREVVVTEAVQVDGIWSRAIRVLGDVGAEKPGEILEIVITSPDRADIDLSAPEQRF